MTEGRFRHAERINLKDKSRGCSAYVQEMTNEAIRLDRSKEEERGEAFARLPFLGSARGRATVGIRYFGIESDRHRNRTDCRQGVDGSA
jgi:hypothetical protein